MVHAQRLRLSPTAINSQMVAGLSGGAIVSSASPGRGAPGQGKRMRLQNGTTRREQAFTRVAGLFLASSVVALAGIGPSTAQTLNEALASAYLSNPTLRAAQAELRRTDEQVPQALAGWRPQADVTARRRCCRQPREPASPPVRVQRGSRCSGPAGETADLQLRNTREHQASGGRGEGPAGALDRRRTRRADARCDGICRRSPRPKHSRVERKA